MIIYFLIISSITIIGVVVGYLFRKQEYASQKIYDRKFEYLLNFYRDINDLIFSVNEYVHFVGADMTKENRQEKIYSMNKIKKSFQQFQHTFWSGEVILDDSTAERINNFLNKYIEITSQLRVSHISQQLRDDETAFRKWDESFQSVNEELPKIKKQIKAEFKESLKRI